MKVWKIVAKRELLGDDHEQFDAFSSLLGSYRQDGHVLGRELMTVMLDKQIEAFVFAPADDAFKPEFQNEWVGKRTEEMKAAGVGDCEFAFVGDDLSEPNGCECSNSSSYILFTTYIQLQSPVRCGDCLRPVPLYRLPRFSSGEFYEVLSWESNWQSCDSLFMGSAVGERFGYREISRVDSSLSKSGRKICSHFEAGTGKATYYYLHRYYGRSRAVEEARKCPGCGGEWRLKERLHNLFDFRCEKCRLISGLSSAIV